MLNTNSRALNTRFILIALALLGAFSTLNTSAQIDSENSETDDQLDGEVVVTATRLSTSANKVPASVSVIDKDSVQLGRQQLSLDESLSGIAGVFIQDRYNLAQDLRVAIRGFGARSNFGIRGVKIIVDGIPETLPDGQGQIDAIDIGSIQQIEVIKGAASSLYGNASGGVINIVSEQGPKDPFVESRVSVGADDFSKYQLKVGGENNRVNYMFDVSRLEYEGYRAHSETKNTQLNGRVKIAITEKQHINVIVNTTDQPVANDPGGVTLEQATSDPRSARQRNVDFNAGEALDQQKIGLVYTNRFKPAHELTLRNYYLQRDFANKLPFVGGGAVQIDRKLTGGGVLYTFDPLMSYSGVHSETNSVDAQALSDDNKVRGHRVLIGLDLDKQDDDRRRFDNQMGINGDLVFDQNEAVESLGAFIQDEFTWSDALTLTAGLRFDRVKFDASDRFVSNGDDSGSRTLTELSPMLGAVFSPNKRVSVYANFATAFETPTTTEFANPDGSGGFNADLQPQLAKNYELGVRAKPNTRNSLELAVFRIDVSDELIPFELASQPGRDFYSNAGASKRVGAELSWLSKPLDSLTFSLAYTYSDFDFDQFVDDSGNDFSANALPGIPKSQLFAELKYQSDNGAYASIDALHVGEMPLNNANSVTNEAYTVVNARAGWQVQLNKVQLSPFIGVNNVADESYFSNVRINAFGGRFFEPAPTRNVYAGIGVRYGF